MQKQSKVPAPPMFGQSKAHDTILTCKIMLAEIKAKIELERKEREYRAKERRKADAAFRKKYNLPRIG